MGSPYKREQTGYVEITRMNVDGKRKFIIQNLPHTHIDIGQHYNKGSITIGEDEVEKLIEMLAMEIGKTVAFGVPVLVGESSNDFSDGSR